MVNIMLFPSLQQVLQRAINQDHLTSDENSTSNTFQHWDSEGPSIYTFIRSVLTQWWGTQFQDSLQGPQSSQKKMEMEKL